MCISHVFSEVSQTQTSLLAPWDHRPPAMQHPVQHNVVVLGPSSNHSGMQSSRSCGWTLRFVVQPLVLESSGVQQDRQFFEDSGLIRLWANRVVRKWGSDGFSSIVTRLYLSGPDRVRPVPSETHDFKGFRPDFNRIFHGNWLKSG